MISFLCPDKLLVSFLNLDYFILLYFPIFYPLYFKKKNILLFIIIGEGREKEREGNIDVREKHQLVVSYSCPIWGLNCNPVMDPDWKLNQRPFTVWEVAQLSHTGHSYPLDFQCQEVSESSFNVIFIFRVHFLLDIFNIFVTFLTYGSKFTLTKFLWFFILSL